MANPFKFDVDGIGLVLFNFLLPGQFYHVVGGEGTRKRRKIPGIEAKNRGYFKFNSLPDIKEVTNGRARTCCSLLHRCFTLAG